MSYSSLERIPKPQGWCSLNVSVFGRGDIGCGGDAVDVSLCASSGESIVPDVILVSSMVATEESCSGT